MAKELVINTTSQETRVALLENGHIAELYIERARERGIVGNIYKGRVIRVLPGMQAAFVDIGLEKAAFLYVADVFDEVEAVEHFIDGGNQGPPVAGEDGDIEDRTLPPIEDLLQEGQEILVQIAKEPLGTKGARITSHISLPGRNLVYMPTVDHVGISRRIESEEEKDRLRAAVEQIRPAGSGFIVRTAAEGKSEEDLQVDMEFLLNLWQDVARRKDGSGAPSLIHSELDVICKVVRDILTEDVRRIVVDSRDEYAKIERFIGTFMPKLKYSMELYEDEEPIFDAFGLEVEIARALGRKVWLKSGGYIIIEQTEALTAIDVNTGRYVGKHNLEDTILKTNLEAVKEIAFQLRLRNIGGLIIIDFIDMEKEPHREKVHAALLEALKSDKSKSNILKISELGLVEMTRQRVRESIGRTLCEACPYCEGKGYIKSRATLAYEIFRELRREMNELAAPRITLVVHPDVAAILYDEERHGIEELEERFGKQITITARPVFHQEQYEILPG
ncbi:RNAse G [Geoalkalibacter ferrihydriticus]|uniref:Ribonuclease G n=2 Tax=Geoalkalibacter ferrihydriticus TaxID=392333 RepID=A0A0C2HGK5_9BACT|nr:Rne/Rng family ribonuclease [Geoalkalibacter ferrihydriticus]KIH76066.1 ribonuclease G [Geoalkalibacter ferrihydriticus DSM 17813]SDM47079.1 RNAse G [Geoalkalibacter ferrihydriticus]